MPLANDGYPTYQVQGIGVHVDNSYRQSTALAGKAEVVVRGYPGQPGRYFAGEVNGTGEPRFLDEIQAHAKRTEAERKADGVSNAIRGGRFRAVLREAGDRLIAEGTPEEDLPPAIRDRNAKRAAGRGKPTAERLGDPAAATRITWNPDALKEGAA